VGLGHAERLLAPDLAEIGVDPGQHEAKGDKAKPDQQQSVTVKPRPGCVFGLFHRPGLRHPVQHDGEKDDGDADFHRKADLKRLEQLQQLLPQPRHPDEAGQHHHRQALHDHLVHADQDFGPGGGQAHARHELQPGRPAHLAAFDDLGRHATQTEEGHADHWRDREDDRDDRARLRAHADEDDDGDHVGEMRQRLGDVEDGVQDALGQARAPG